jgi:hypothetical protein
MKEYCDFAFYDDEFFIFFFQILLDDFDRLLNKKLLLVTKLFSFRVVSFI